MKLRLWEYNGPVMAFENVIDRNFKAKTQATSEAKAKANLAFRYKKSHGLMPGAKITLPGKLSLVE